MTAKIIDGKKIASNLKNTIADQVKDIRKKYNITPTLAVILVGNDPASEVYVRNKERAAHLVGMNSAQYKLSADISEKELIAKIDELNNDENVHGVLVQLPLPKHINSNNIISAIDCRKDVDGFNISNVGKLSIGQVKGEDGAMIPCTPLGCLHLIRSALGSDLSGLKALVIGTSNIVGRPLIRLLLLEKCTVTAANSKTRDLKAECLRSDIIISATGIPNLVKADMVSENSVIIDVGINRISIGDNQSKLVGDVDFENVKNIAGAITPVPGGVGPMTIAYLLQNTATACLNIARNSY